MALFHPDSSNQSTPERQRFVNRREPQGKQERERRLSGRAAILFCLALFVLLPNVTQAQAFCGVTDIRREPGFNLFTGVVTFKDKNDNFLQAMPAGQNEKGGSEFSALKMFDKSGSFVSASFTYPTGDGKASFKTGEELKKTLDEYVAGKTNSKGTLLTTLIGLDLPSTKAVDFNITTGQVTFKDKSGNCLAVTTVAGMTFDFMTPGSRTGAKLFVNTFITWAMAKGIEIPLTNQSGEKLLDVVLPSVVTEEAQLRYGY